MKEKNPSNIDFTLKLFKEEIKLRLKSICDYEMVNIFNRNVRNRICARAKFIYLFAITRELENRDISLKNITTLENGSISISYAYAVYLDVDRKLVQIKYD